MENKAINELSFEESLNELENVVRTLESGGQKLEDSIKAYKRGVELKTHCEKTLKESKLVVEKILADGGDVKTAPLDDE